MPPPRMTKNLSRRLSCDSVTFYIPTNAAAELHVEERDKGQETWEYYVLSKLHSRPMQILLSCLLMLDVLLLFVELFLLATYPDCSIIERDGISCCPTLTSDEPEQHRWLASKDSHHGVCVSGFEESGTTAGCDEHKWETVHTIEEVLFIFTLAILSFFLLELTLTMICLRPHIFVRQFWYVLDYAIVSISLALEVTYHFLKEENSAAVLAGVLVIGRIWRFVRIGHGLLEVSHEVAQHEYEHLLAYTEDLQAIMAQNGLEVPAAPVHVSHNELLERIEYEHRHPHGGSTLHAVKEESAEHVVDTEDAKDENEGTEYSS